jgi:thiol-disulfide isomerase/thioredoxin
MKTWDQTKYLNRESKLLPEGDMMGDRLLMFSGAECKHCKEMDPIVEQVNKELNVKIEHVEVWHDSNNKKIMESYDKDDNGKEFCGGVPFFYNEKTGAKICGNTTVEKMKAWASGN